MQVKKIIGIIGLHALEKNPIITAITVIGNAAYSHALLARLPNSILFIINLSDLSNKPYNKNIPIAKTSINVSMFITIILLIQPPELLWR